VAKSDGTWTLLTDLIEGQFPDHTKVMPTKIKHTATMPRADLLAAVRRAKLAAPKSGHCVTLSLSDGELTLNAISPEFGEARETLATDHKGPNFSIGFNAAYLADALTHLSGDTIKAQFQDELSPALWSGDSAASYAVTMPMRV
jgi:DNA polymerase-3 subunit beta